MIRLMIGRDLKSLYIPPERAARRARARDRRACAPRPIPTTRSTCRCARGEILGHGRAWSAPGRTELARAIFGIDRAGRRASCGSTARPIAIALAARRHRARHLPGAGGPQALRAGARRLGHREHLAARPRGLSPRPADPHAAPSARNAPSGSARAQHPDGLRRHAWSARCRAATSRRWCWPSGCR